MLHEDVTEPETRDNADQDQNHTFLFGHIAARSGIVCDLLGQGSKSRRPIQQVRQDVNNAPGFRGCWKLPENHQFAIQECLIKNES
jgi:hypothetical protein